jgi:UDP-glucuronate 4-epimerase
MQQGDVNITYADIQKAQKLLGYKISTPFSEGIKKFIPWVKSLYEKFH